MTILPLIFNKNRRSDINDFSNVDFLEFDYRQQLSRVCVGGSHYDCPQGGRLTSEELEMVKTIRALTEKLNYFSRFLISDINPPKSSPMNVWFPIIIKICTSFCGRGGDTCLELQKVAT